MMSSAPAWMALNEIFRSSLLTEALITRIGVGFSAMINWVAWNPSMTGMRMSIVTTSGRSSRTRSTASWPLRATPTTLICGSDSRIFTRTLRAKSESSATSTRIAPPRARHVPLPGAHSSCLMVAIRLPWSKAPLTM